MTTGKLPQARVLGKYHVLNEIGRGSFGIVYLAHDTSLDNYPVALKFLPPTLARDKQASANFVREAQVATRINHPNVVRVYEVQQTGQYLYLAMQYVDGSTLADRLKQGPLAPAQVVQMVTQVGAALEAAHQLGLLHGDIKPSNILFDRTNNQWYLADFGLARVRNTLGLASSGGLSGTLAYLSPEQAREEPTDARADIYSLAVVAYEALTGRPAFVADTAYGYIRAHTLITPPAPSEINPVIPASFDAPLLQALDKSPAGRPSTAPDFARSLVRAMNTATAPPSAPGAATASTLITPDRHTTAGQWQAYVQLASILIIALGLGLGGLLLLTPGVYLSFFGELPQVADISPTPSSTPTATPRPTGTPRPTSTPAPSATPVPTRTPPPSPSPVPTVDSAAFSDSFNDATLSANWRPLEGRLLPVLGVLTVGDLVAGQTVSGRLTLETGLYQSVQIAAEVRDVATPPDRFFTPNGAAVAFIVYQQTDGSGVALVIEQSAIQFARVAADGQFSIIPGSRVTTSIDFDAPQTVRFEASGPRLLAYINDELVTRATYNGPFEGQIGIFMRSGLPIDITARRATPKVDQFAVQVLSNPTDLPAVTLLGLAPYADDFEQDLRPDWQLLSGEWGVTNGALTLNRLTPGRITEGWLRLSNDLPWQDVDVTFRARELAAVSNEVFLFDGNAAVGVLLAVQPDGSGVGLVLERQSAAFATYTTAQGWQMIPASRVLHSIDFAANPSLRVSRRGAFFAFSVDDELLTSVDLPALPPGDIALYLRSALPVNPADPDLVPLIDEISITPSE